jgi:3'-phosphoadenosine 5'-phosphosulfate sulfotransferase (PAPS reductase)/FAD synthetase
VVSISEVVENLDSDDRRHVISISGGKDSAALAVYIQNEYPQIHARAEYVFCDTLVELPETDEYIERLESMLDVQVHRVTAFDNLNIAAKPGRTPFDIYLREVYGDFLPSPRSRWCTRKLKIEPFERFVGDSHVYSYIGIRADEDRDGYQSQKPPKFSEKPNIIPVYPFRDDDLRLADIKQLLEHSGLGLPAYYEWRSRSGCYFCFYQQIGEWQRLQKNHPDKFEAAKKYENESKGFTWNEGRTLDQIAALPEQPLPVVDETNGCAICHL